VIAVTAILAGPRLTFLLLLAWGVVAVGYLLARPTPDPAEGPATGRLAAYRGDGILAYRLGNITRGTLPPLLPVFVALLVTCVLAALGLGNLPGALILLPLIVTLFPALGARHRHDGRLDWLAPPLIQTSECVFLAALGFSRHVAAALVFALVAAVLLRHADRLGRADTAGGPGRRGRHRAVRLRGARRLSLAPVLLGLPQRVARSDRLRPGSRYSRNAA
jgi:hypothetical protein